ncbi:MAG: DUF3137 domain-containing protein [Roseburia sp.]|nr:DUF3137 domain-containing protein [Roseburia sp.]
MEYYNVSDVTSSRFKPTRVDDPTFFSDEGERYDFSEVHPELSEDARKLFDYVRQKAIDHETALRNCIRKSNMISIPITVVLVILCLLYEPALVIHAAVWGYFFTTMICWVILMQTDKKYSETKIDYFEEKFADMCIEPLIAQIESGVDVSYRLIFYPVYGYIEKRNKQYSMGCTEFGLWMYNVGILPSFNDRFKVGISINTLNANREGFFLTNGEAWSEYRSNKHTRRVRRFKGPILTVRLKHEIQGWFVCHTTERGILGGASAGMYRKIKNPIDVESQQFNDNFNVTASSQMNAFYVLSPLVIEKLFELKNRCKKFGIYITGELCIFAINNERSYFDVPNSLEDAQKMDVDTYWRDLVGLVNFVYLFKDAIDLNFK